MQNEFKERILEYLVGNYTTESPKTNVNVSENEVISSEIYTTLQTLTNCSIKGRMTDYDNKYIIVYGTYGNNQTYFDGQGFILMADFDFNVIQLFTTYEGGTALPNIFYMNTAEDGTFYAITANTSGVASLTMFNNFTLTLTGTYGVKFRISYQLHNTLQSADIPMMKVGKKIGSANYIFVAPYGTGPSSIDSVILSTVQINVGSENTWTNLVYNVDITYYQAGSVDYTNGFTTFISWVGDNYYVKIGGENNGHYIEYKSVNSGPLSTYTSTFNSRNLSKVSNGGVVMTSYNTTYVATIYDNYNIYKVENNSESLIYSREVGNPGGYSQYFIINQTNNNIFFAAMCTYYGTGILGLVDGNNVYEIGNSPEIYEYTIIYSTSQFNMNNIYIDNLTSSVDKFVLIYNTNNYNAGDYQALNSMIPNSSILYDENDKIIFARNLYNRIINANTTESIIEIPNTYLNDTTISTEELYSETNSLLNQETQEITKNIYESVYINFFNTIGMSNQNDPDNIIINQNGASRLNQSISNTNHYDDVKIGLVKVNFNDNTNQEITAFGITQNSSTSYTIDFTIYVSKPITSIQIMSNDGNTAYQTINPTLETEKLYKITQDVKIV